MADRGRGSVRGGIGARGGPIKRPMGGPLIPPPPPPSASAAEKPRKEGILDLAKYINERIRVRFTGGREVTGVLKGYDQLLNMVLDDVTEDLQFPEPHSRPLGLAVLRGPTITVIHPVEGTEEIANPFLTAEQ